MVRPKEYVAHPGLSQSDLAIFEKNISQFHAEVILGGEREDKKSNAMDLGSIIDNILIDKENLKNYYVMAEFKASGKEKDVVDGVARIIKEEIKLQIEDKEAKPEALNMMRWPALAMFEKEILIAADAIAYQTNWKLETRIAKIKENGKEYFEQLKEAGDKYIVSLETWNKAHSLLEQIKEDESTNGIFKMIRGEIPDAAKKRYIINKTTALFGVDPVTGEPIKGLMDIYIDDTKDKIIYPWDIKTAKSLAQFLDNYRKGRYGRQGSFYSGLLRLKYPKHKIDLFKFLVIPTESGEAPEVFKMSESEVIANCDGAESPAGYHIMGYRELLQDIQWHRKENKWLHRKKYYETGFNWIAGNLNVDPALLIDNSEVIF